MGWAALGWSGAVWVALGWGGVGCTGVGWVALGWSGVGCAIIFFKNLQVAFSTDSSNI